MNKEVGKLIDESCDARPCPRCGKNPAVDCGYGYWSPDTPNGPGEFDCTFPWPDGEDDEQVECDDCPHLWCKECKDNLLARWPTLEKFCREAVAPTFVEPTVGGFCIGDHITAIDAFLRKFVEVINNGRD